LPCWVRVVFALLGDLLSLKSTWAGELWANIC
jgi:hypothetical protein